MSNLTLALIILGGLLLAAVVAYNAWVSHRDAPRQPDFDDGEAPGMGERPRSDTGGRGAGDRIEPGFGDAAPRLDPGFDPMPPGLVPEGSEPGGLPHGHPGVLDTLIDVIAPIAIDTVVSGDAALAALPSTRRAGSKPVAVEGLNGATGQWELPTPGRRYQAFQIGVQLANRTGALNEIEYSDFVVKAQAFADAIGGAPEFPEMLEEVNRARELDSFASAHDAELGFVLRAQHAAWSPGYVQQSASRLGFVAGAIPGRMVLPVVAAGAQPQPMLGLAFDTQAALADDPAQSAIRELRLSLDVPLVPRTERPFERMREVAATLAREMDGVVTDSDGQRLQDVTMDAIGGDLEQLYDALDQHDLSAGSPLARRLFS